MKISKSWLKEIKTPLHMMQNINQFMTEEDIELQSLIEQQCSMSHLVWILYFQKLTSSQRRDLKFLAIEYTSRILPYIGTLRETNRKIINAINLATDVLNDKLSVDKLPYPPKLTTSDSALFFNPALKAVNAMTMFTMNTTGSELHYLPSAAHYSCETIASATYPEDSTELVIAETNWQYKRLLEVYQSWQI